MMTDVFSSHGLVQAAGWLCLLIAGTGLLYNLAAAICVKLFFRRTDASPARFPAISILKPLHGAEADLRANLEMLCRLDYPGAIEIICGVQDPQDPAIGTVQQLQRDYPDRQIKLVVDPREYGANRKISNVINIGEASGHDILVLSDSDIGITRDYLARIVAELEKPGVGLVTCLYRGQAQRGFWPRLAAMGIDYHFLPSVMFGMRVGLAKPCFGSTMALHRSTLEKIGGFAAFANQLADDNAIGEAVRAAGFKVAIPPMLVTHACTENRLPDMIKHEIRWSRTIRLVAGPGFAGSVITHPLPFALAAAAILPGALFGAAIVGATLLARLYLHRQVDRVVGVDARSGRWWLMPLRDALSFVVFCATFFVAKVTWRGRQFAVGADGILAAVEEL